VEAREARQLGPAAEFYGNNEWWCQGLMRILRTDPEQE
jgi:hypothetical protein